MMYFSLLFFFLNKIKLTGHPLVIFSEKDSDIIRRSFLIKSLQRNGNIKSHHQTLLFSLKQIFSNFFNHEIRKKRYEIILKNEKNFFSFLGLQTSAFLMSKINYSRFELYIQPNIEKKWQQKKNLRPYSFFQKKMCFSSCFTKGENGIILGSTNGKISVYAFEKKLPLFLIKNGVFTILDLKSHPCIPNMFLSAQNNHFKLWGLSSSVKFLQTLSGLQMNSLLFCDFRKEGNLIDFCVSEKIWKIFDIENERWSWVQTLNEKIFCIESGGLNNLNAIGTTSKVLLFDNRTGKNIIRLTPSTGPITSLKWIQNNFQLIGSGNKNRGTLWDLRKQNMEKVCMVHKDIITSLDCHPNSKFIYSSSFDRTSKVWLKNDWSLLKTFYCGKKKLKNNSVSDCGLLFSTTNIYNKISVWRI